MKYLFLSLIFLFSIQFSNAQSKKYKIATIAFYNLENIYDTIEDPFKNDDEFTPNGKKKYSSSVYLDKLQKLSKPQIRRIQQE